MVELVISESKIVVGLIRGHVLGRLELRDTRNNKVLKRVDIRQQPVELRPIQGGADTTIKYCCPINNWYMVNLLTGGITAL